MGGREHHLNADISFVAPPALPLASAATGLQGGPEPRGANSNPPSNDYNYHINTSSSSQGQHQPRTQNPDYPSDMWSTSTGSFTPTSGEHMRLDLLLSTPSRADFF